MSGRFAVESDAFPTVLERLPRSEIDHRFDCKHHTHFEFRTVSCLAVVRHCGVFVHFSADSVSDHRPYHAVSARFVVNLHRVGYISESSACLKLFHTFKETLSRSFDEAFLFFADFAHEEGSCRVRLPAFENESAVDADYLAFFESSFGGESVNDNFVDRRANRSGESAVSEEGRSRIVPFDIIVSKFVKTFCRYSRFHSVAEEEQAISEDCARLPHTLDFMRAFDVNHSSTFFMSAKISSFVPLALMSTTLFCER